MPTSKVFFSYARNDKSSYLDDFFEKLREEIMHKAPVESPQQACFRDTDNVEIGNRWNDEMLHALKTTSVLVCMYSPSYFLSEYCGKEVHVFQSRIDEYKKNEDDTPDVILPVLWETPTTYDIPEALNEIQFTHSNIHRDYPIKGLLTLSKLKKYSDAYLEFIEQLALKIINVSRSVVLPPVEIQDISVELSAFSINSPPNHRDAISINSEPNFKQTRVIFAVGTKTELDAVKEHTDCYGKRGEYWKPFTPEDDEIGIIANLVVVEKKLHYVSVEFSDNLVGIIREAENNNCVTILIVDPWSAKIAKYKNGIKQLDDKRFINSTILIVWNTNDTESNEKKGELENNLNNTLSRYIVDNTTGIIDGVDTLDGLKTTMSMAIDDARTKLRKRAEVFQTIDAEATSIPLLNLLGEYKYE